MQDEEQSAALRRILIIGTGLIGGSFALALKRRLSLEVWGWERDPAALQQALALGVIDHIPPDFGGAVAAADLILLAAPVAQTGPILRSLLPFLASHTIITDCGSTKQDVVLAARAELGTRISQFVPAHPIAGGERHGPQAAKAELFVGKKVVLTPLPENAEQSVELVAACWRACGALIHRLLPQEHDQVFASVSHLPHVLAFALVEQIANHANAAQLFNYAASGFRDFTRIAASSPEMWRDISLANQSALLQELDDYLLQLQRMRGYLAGADGASLHAVYARAQQARQAWQQTIEAAESSLPKPSEI